MNNTAETKPKKTELQEISTLVYVNIDKDIPNSNDENYEEIQQSIDIEIQSIIGAIGKTLVYAYRHTSKIKDGQKLTNPFTLIIVGNRAFFQRYTHFFYQSIDEYKTDKVLKSYFQLQDGILLDPSVSDNYTIPVILKGDKTETNIEIHSGNITLSDDAKNTLTKYSSYDKNYPTFTGNDGITVYLNRNVRQMPGMETLKNLVGVESKKMIKKYYITRDKAGSYRKQGDKDFKKTDVEDITEEAAVATGGKTRKHRKRKMRSSKRKASKKGRKSRKKKSSSKKKK